jgi:hypothetical protein
MADFCLQCSLDMFDKDFKDLATLGEDGDKLPRGFGYAAICEGCGFILVDNFGVCLGGCEAKHEIPPKWMTNYITFNTHYAMWIAWDETQANELGKFFTYQEAISACWVRVTELANDYQSSL